MSLDNLAKSTATEVGYLNMHINFYSQAKNKNYNSNNSRRRISCMENEINTSTMLNVTNVLEKWARMRKVPAAIDQSQHTHVG